MTTNKCTGLCCTRFYLPFSPTELDQGYRRKLADSRGEKTDGMVWEDIEVIAPMVVYLGYSPINAAGAFAKECAHYYTCKHFDTQHKLCKIYEHRPSMCRKFPYGNVCEYPGCSFQEPDERKHKELTLEAGDKDTRVATARQQPCVERPTPIDVLAVGMDELRGEFARLGSVIPQEKSGR